MTVSVTARDAVRLHAVIEEKLALSDRFEGEAFVGFAEFMQRHLYRDLGCGSIQHYAEERLGFSPSKTAQWIRLVSSIRTLPRLFDALRSGRLPWTTARVVAGVAAPKTEQRWIEEAIVSSHRTLSRKIDLARAAARQSARGGSGQDELPGSTQPTDEPIRTPRSTEAISPAGGRAGGSADPPISDPSDRASRPALPEPPPGRTYPSQIEPIDVPVPITLRFTAEQCARYHALVEALRKSGRREVREELVLASLADALDAIGNETPGETQSASQKPGPRRRRATTGVRYRVVTYMCETCGRAHAPTARGDRVVSMAELEAQLGAGEVLRPGTRVRRVVSKRVRDQVMRRDGHRCKSPGCTNTRFLDVHHRVPIARGGTNEPNNLITLCHACHRALHEREGKRLQQDTRVQHLRAELGIRGERRSAKGGRERSP